MTQSDHAFDFGQQPAAARRVAYEWLAWLVALLAGVVVLGALYAMRPDESALAPWRDPMTVVIAALFGAACWRSFAAVRELDREARLQSLQIALLNELNDVKEFLRRAEPSLFRQHIASLHAILLRHSQIEQDNLIEILHARLTSRNRTVELLANVLITLGLVGTIIGLLLSVSSLSAALEPSSGAGVEGVLRSLRGTISALGTAFYTTLAGALLGGVILRILGSVVEAAIQRHVAAVAELTDVFVLPALRRVAEHLRRTGYYERLDGRAS